MQIKGSLFCFKNPAEPLPLLNKVFKKINKKKNVFNKLRHESKVVCGKSTSCHRCH